MKSKEVEFVLALRTIAAPHRVDYHAEFHARPSINAPFCTKCALIQAIIVESFVWVGGDEGSWELKK